MKDQNSRFKSIGSKFGGHRARFAAALSASGIILGAASMTRAEVPVTTVHSLPSSGETKVKAPTNFLAAAAWVVEGALLGYMMAKYDILNPADPDDGQTGIIEAGTGPSLIKASNTTDMRAVESILD